MNTYKFLGLFTVQLAPGFEKFSDVFSTITGKLAVIITFLVGFPAIVSTLSPQMQAQVPAWLLNACQWLAVFVAAGLLPGRATKEGDK